MKTNPNEPASAILETQIVQGHETMDYSSKGLTKRELFASTAMQGLLANYDEEKLSELSEWVGVRAEQALAEMSVELADALIEALNKKR